MNLEFTTTAVTSFERSLEKMTTEELVKLFTKKGGGFTSWHRNMVGLELRERGHFDD
jgi:uncharacterized protein YneR